MGGVLPLLTGVSREPERSAVSRPALVGVAPPPPVLDAPAPAASGLGRRRVRAGIFPVPTVPPTAATPGLLPTRGAGVAVTPSGRS